MNIHETNCICLSNLTNDEWTKYFDIMGENSYWNDDEDIVCVPLKEIERDLLAKLKEFVKADLSKADYLIIRF